eukprot:2077729-Pyramimonas_sp.AAC.1
MAQVACSVAVFSNAASGGSEDAGRLDGAEQDQRLGVASTDEILRHITCPFLRPGREGGVRGAARGGAGRRSLCT